MNQIQIGNLMATWENLIKAFTQMGQNLKMLGLENGGTFTTQMLALKEDAISKYYSMVAFKTVRCGWNM